MASTTGVPVTFDKIVKSFGPVRVLEELSLTIAPGEFLVLLGASGSGKTTALRILAGLETASSGRILIGDRDVTEVLPKYRDVSMVFQSYALYPHKTVAENIGFPLKVRKVPKDEQEAAVRDAAAQVQIDQLLERYPRQLSGGQRQRVALARAMVRRPSVFLMDEPLSNLDAKLRGHMRAELKHMQSTLGTTTIYVTHDQIEAMTLAHRVAILEKGVLQQLDTPAKIYNDPANLFVAQFIGSPPMNVVHGTLDGAAFQTRGDRVDVAVSGRIDKAILGVRPEDCGVVPAGQGHIGAEIYAVELIGDHTLVTGARYQKGDLETVTSLTNRSNLNPGSLVFDPSTASVASDLDRVSVYAYDTWQLLPSLRFTAGGSYERLYFPVNIDQPPTDAGQQTKDKLSPKLGLEWSPLTNANVRTAWTRSLGGSYYDTSVRLEPVQVAGFTQAFRSLVPESVVSLVPGSAFETFGAGVDYRFPTRTYLDLSGEVLRSDAGQNYGAYTYTSGDPLAGPATFTRGIQFEERTLAVTLNQLIADRWAVGARYRVSEAALDESYPPAISGLPTSPARDVSATLHQVTGFVRFNHESGFFTEFAGMWSQQSNRGYGVGAKDLPGDDFWQFNLVGGYRFLQRRCEVRLGVLNLTGQDYRLNPLNLHEEYPRERTLYTSLRLNF